jgi:hypothetical protein
LHILGCKVRSHPKKKCLLSLNRGKKLSKRSWRKRGNRKKKRSFKDWKSAKPSLNKLCDTLKLVEMRKKLK